MPVLDNARHERFAQELVKGASQVEAYRLAGYEPVEANASRLIRNDKVAARVAELKEAAAERAEITIYDIASQLDEDREFARGLEAPAAAISATMGKAKVLGLIVDKSAATDAAGKDLPSDTELARMIAFLLTKAAREAE